MKFDPVSICRILNEEHVDYVVVGGFASVILGSPLPTEDVDVLPERSHENLVRLATALERMNAKIRTADEAVPAMLDAEFLANMPMMLNLITDFGILGLTFEPSGSLHGYADWSADASSDPDARPCLLTSAEKKIAEGGADVVRRLIDGEALAGNVPGTVGLAPYHDAEVRVPEEVKQQVAQVVEQLSQGTLTTGVDF